MAPARWSPLASFSRKSLSLESGTEVQEVRALLERLRGGNRLEIRAESVMPEPFGTKVNAERLAATRERAVHDFWCSARGMQFLNAAYVFFER
ncbi:hypothetical protein [Ramlibacter sp. AN1133]|uniref:hypothetical protein n=1 Tax=Ramlibacter sp. AN1133 TaxID=3133429 RepID=UPI0030C5F410